MEFVLCIVGVSNSLVPMSLGTILFVLLLYEKFGDALDARLTHKEGDVTMCLLESS